MAMVSLVFHDNVTEPPASMERDEKSESALKTR
jgi:hypothetical protein